MTHTWTSREATIEDAEAIAQLDRVVNNPLDHVNRPGSIWDGDPRSIWQWWMLDNPTGKSLAYLSEDNGHVIGHMASVGIWFI